MDLAFAAKIICDLSLWYSTAGFVLSYFGAEPNLFPPLIMLIVCLASSILVSKKTSVRLIPLPLLILCFFWVHHFSDILLILPPLSYCIWICYGERFSPDYDSSVGYYKTSSIVLLVLTVLVLITAGTGPLINIFKYVILFLFSGVLMLRLLRHNEQNRRDLRLHLIDFILLILCFAAAVFLSSGIFVGTMAKIIGVLYQYIAQPLLLAVSYLFVIIIWLFMKLAGFFKSGGSQQKFELQDPNVKEFMKLDPNMQTVRSDFLMHLLTALGIIAFLFLAFFIFRRLAADKAKRGGSAISHISTTSDSAERPSLRSILAPQTPRDMVRNYYRKFLYTIRAGGISIRPCDTSENISLLAENQYDPALISELRELYIVARYSPETVTKEDARHAKEIYVKLKKSHK